VLLYRYRSLYSYVAIGGSLIVGVMSDTHDNVELTLKAIRIFLENNIDTIIHLGDIISPFMPRFIKGEIGDEEVKIISVLGNNDGDPYMLAKLFNEYKWILLPSPSVIELDGIKVYLMHGFNGIDFTEAMARSLLRNMDVEILLYGHTHRYREERINNKLLLNPGEVCGYLTGNPSIAILDTDRLTVKRVGVK